MTFRYNAGEKIIVDKGKQLIWQNPRKDKSVIVQLARISPRNGYNDLGQVSWDRIETPLDKGYFHFYQIGDNYPGDFTLIAKKNQWYRLSEWCKIIDLVVRAYNKRGVQIPIKDIYQIRLYNDNIIIAIERNDNIMDLNEEIVYLHFYRNYYYATDLKDSQSIHIEYLSNTHSETSLTSDFITSWGSLPVRPKGMYRMLYNGYLRNHVDVNQAKLNDVCEFFYDMSIIRMVDIKVSDLRTFKSTLDSKNKYILHLPKEKDKDMQIRYRDDIDIYVYKKAKDSTEINGLYYHRNQEDSVRMLTHNDYALPVAYVMYYIEQLDAHADLNDFYIRLYIRDNGYPYPIVEDCNMISSLYILPDDKIIEAMATVDSTVPEWTANVLEQSAYTAVMRSYHHELTPALMLDAFGYSTSAKILANPNNKIINYVNGAYFDLPVGLRESITVYEYNKNGLLLGWYTQKGLSKYYPRNPSCVFIEAINGEGGDDINMHIGNTPFDMLNQVAYRFYTAKVEQGTVVGYWKDSTADKRILIDGNRCTFNYQTDNEVGVAIGDDKFLAYDLELDGNDGILDFKLTHEINHVKGLIIPPGKIDLWLNGHALIEDVDYFVDFPKIMVVNKKYLLDNRHQKVTIRCTGFPIMKGNYLQRNKPRDIGFVQYGKVSANAYYNIHPSKLLRVVVNGGVFDPNDIPFDEQAVAKVPDYTVDGNPFAIEHPYVSLRGSLGISLYRSMFKDFDLTHRASDYLTLHLPKIPRPLPPVIPDKYEVYSPFLSRITTDLMLGRLRSPLSTVSIQTVDKIVERYKVYLPMDPTYRGYDKHFVNVHAHNRKELVTLSARDVVFLERLNDIYLKGMVDVSKFYRIRNGK